MELMIHSIISRSRLTRHAHKGSKNQVLKLCYAQRFILFFFLREREKKNSNMRRGTKTGSVSAQRQRLGNTPNPRVKRAAAVISPAGCEVSSPPCPGRRLRARAAPSAPAPGAGRARRTGVASVRPSAPPPATQRTCASPPPVTSYIISQANHDGSEPNCHRALARDNHPQEQTLWTRTRSSLTSRPGALLERSSQGWNRLPQQPDAKRSSPSRAARRPPQEAASIASGISLSRARSADPAGSQQHRRPARAAAGSLLRGELEEKVTRRPLPLAAPLPAAAAAAQLKSNVTFNNLL